MDINLTPTRTLDFGIAYEIANTTEIFEAFTEDGAPDYMPDVVNEYWVLMITENGSVAGAYRLKSILARTVEIHAFMLPEYRNDYSKLSGVRILEWCLDNLDFDKITTVIPQLYKNIYHFTKAMGFKEEGFNRSSFLKDGKLHGMYCMGITKQEIIESLEVLK